MVTFRRPPRLPPPKPPKGKNVIPFPSDRVKPPGGTRLGDIVPDPPINLEQIRKAKELELRNAIQSEGMSPFPEGKGLSGLGEEAPVKDLSKENISNPEDQQLFILNRERMTPEQRAMRERDDEVILNELETLDRTILNKRYKELKSNLNKLLSEDPRSDKKNSQGLPLIKTQISIARHYLDLLENELQKRRDELVVDGKLTEKGREEIIRLRIEQGVSTKEREQRRSLREQQGLSGLGEEVPVKTDIEKYVDVLNKQKRSERMKGLNNLMRDIVIYYNSSREPLKNLPLEDLVDDLNEIRKLITNDEGVPISVKRIEKLRAVYDKIFKEVKVRRIKEAQERKKTPEQIKRLDVIKQRVKDKFTKALGPIEDYPKKPEKFKGLKKDIKDLSESMEKFNERNDPALDAISKAAKEIDKAGEASKKIIEASEARKGLSGLGEDIKEKGKIEGEWLDSVFGSMTEQIKPKDVSKQKWITEIEDYGLDVEEIKSIVMYNIAKRWDKDTEPRALSKKEWIEELKDWEGMEDDPQKFLGPWFREWLESLQKGDE
jgi:uncharacterized protein YoxC